MLDFSPRPFGPPAFRDVLLAMTASAPFLVREAI
jgi:hypothetical protein